MKIEKKNICQKMIIFHEQAESDIIVMTAGSFCTKAVKTY